MEVHTEQVILAKKKKIQKYSLLLFCTLFLHLMVKY